MPTLQPGECKQFAPGQLAAQLDPVVRQTIEDLATFGYLRDGRGALLIELDDTAQRGIRNAQYFPIAELAEISRNGPPLKAQPLNDTVAGYDPEREFVVMVLDVTPSLRNPQIWFDVCQCTAVPS